MLARILREADPVVTCGPERLRFEGFSACCSTYARVDFEPGAVDGVLLGSGTTNVDFNPPMRAALARIREREPVALSVGSGEVELRLLSGAVVERRVSLPARWIRGFVEAQACQARMRPRLQAGATEARRFLRGLPRQASGGRPAWVSQAGSGLRLGQAALRGAIRVAGIERLRVLEELCRHARGLRVYAAEEDGASAWELTVADARFTLVLSPETWRGFSGEGQALAALARGGGAETRSRVLEAIRRGAAAAPAEGLASACELPAGEVGAALAELGASGLVGFDLAAGTYFHRELPFDLSAIEAMQPRLRGARALAAAGDVQVDARGPEGIEAWVRGSGVEHRVRLTSEGARCTCPWHARHRGERGPCKHILAVQITLGEPDDA